MITGRLTTQHRRVTLKRVFQPTDRGPLKVEMGVFRQETPEHLSMISLTLKIIFQDLWLWKLVPYQRRPRSEPLARMQIVGHTAPSCTGFNDSTVRTFRKCACTCSGYITQLLSHVANSTATAKAKKDTFCRQILLCMSELPIQMPRLYRDCEAA